MRRGAIKRGEGRTQADDACNQEGRGTHSDAIRRAQIAIQSQSDRNQIAIRSQSDRNQDERRLEHLGPREPRRVGGVAATHIWESRRDAIDGGTAVGGHVRRRRGGGRRRWGGRREMAGRRPGRPGRPPWKRRRWRGRRRRVAACQRRRQRRRRVRRRRGRRGRRGRRCGRRRSQRRQRRRGQRRALGQRWRLHARAAIADAADDRRVRVDPLVEGAVAPVDRRRRAEEAARGG